MKKKYIIIFTTLIITILAGIGGKIYMDEKKEEKISIYKENEKEIVLDVLKNYDNIHKIKFIKIEENSMTGFTHYSFSLNDISGFSYYFNKNEMYGDESTINNKVKERKVKLEKRSELKELCEQIEVKYGGWEE